MKYPVAIVDYGIGGLGLFKMIHEEFPNLPVLYFSDSGEVPYGRQSKKQLRTRLEKVFTYLFEEGAGKIIVACHAASSVVRESDVNVIGLRKQTIRAVMKHKPASVGIIGGGRTIRSGYYRRMLNKAGIEARQRIAQPLSILIERGETDTPLVEREVAKILRPLASCGTILLACTHYPVLSGLMQKHLPGGTRLVDPVKELYASVHSYLRKSSTQTGRCVFLTSGDKSLMVRAARKAFAVRIKSVRSARL